MYALYVEKKYISIRYTLIQCYYSGMDAGEKGKSSQLGRARQFLMEIFHDEKSTKQFICTLCDGKLNGTCGSNLVSHFKSRHKDIFAAKIAVSSEDSFAAQRLKLIYSCVELVAINSQPFSLLTCSGFISAIQHKLQAFQLAGCPLNLSDHHVRELKETVIEIARNIKEQVKIEMRNKLISVMVDGATRNGRSIFGINVQYKIDGVLKVVTLAMRELNSAHTAEYLGNVLQDVLNEYGVSLSQIISVTTDNGSNMLAMVKDLENKLFGDLDSNDENENQIADSDIVMQHDDTGDDGAVDIANISDEETAFEIEQVLQQTELTDDDALNLLFDDSSVYQELLEKLVGDLRKKSGNHHLFMASIKCAAHTLQLAVNDALKLLQRKDGNIISLCRVVAKFIRLPSTRNEMYRMNLDSILPKLDVETRWSSTYLMVRIQIYFFLILFNC